MSISSKFSVAVHVMLLIGNSKGDITSSLMAGSVNTNPVVIRRIIGALKKNNLLTVDQGKSNYSFSNKPSQITLLNIYKAVQSSESDCLFNIHENPNIDCEVGATIQLLLESILDNAQEAMEGVLRAVTIQDLLNRMKLL